MVYPTRSCAVGTVRAPKPQIHVLYEVRKKRQKIVLEPRIVFFKINHSAFECASAFVAFKAARDSLERGVHGIEAAVRPEPVFRDHPGKHTSQAVWEFRSMRCQRRVDPPCELRQRSIGKTPPMPHQKVIEKYVHDNTGEATARDADPPVTRPHNGVAVGVSVDAPMQRDSGTYAVGVCLGGSALDEIAEQRSDGHIGAAACEKNVSQIIHLQQCKSARKPYASRRH